MDHVGSDNVEAVIAAVVFGMIAYTAHEPDWIKT